MDLETYMKETQVTWREELSRRDQFLNLEWGIIGETCEVLELIKKDHFHPHRDIPETKYLEECGDVLYYCTTWMRLTGQPFGVGTPPYHGYEEQGRALTNGLRSYLTSGEPHYIVAVTQGILQYHGFTVEEARQANIDKLRAKYPDGFPKGKDLTPPPHL